MMNSVNWGFENIEFKDTLEGMPKLLYGEESISAHILNAYSMEGTQFSVKYCF